MAEIACRAIETYSDPDDLVLNPFCGDGLILLEAILRGDVAPATEAASARVGVPSLCRFCATPSRESRGAAVDR